VQHWLHAPLYSMRYMQHSWLSCASDTTNCRTSRVHCATPHAPQIVLQLQQVHRRLPALLLQLLLLLLLLVLLQLLLLL
jgi:hypothetical protein